MAKKTTEKDVLIGRDTVETEAAGFLALPEEVLEEVVQHVSVPVELQETLQIGRASCRERV